MNSEFQLELDKKEKGYAFCSDGAEFRQNVAANQP